MAMITEPDGTLVEKVAKAIRDASVAMARKMVEEQVLPLERIQGAFEVAKTEADRSASILLFALAEDIMLDSFKVHLNSKVKGGWSEVTGGNGLLATASDRITLLELLFWIQPQTCADLRLMKSIRNRFAHHAEVNGFLDAKLSGWVSSMTAHEEPALAVMASPDGADLPRLSLRNRFLMRSLGALVSLTKDLAVGPIAMKQRVGPSELTAGGYDGQPQNLKNATLFQAGMYVDIVREFREASDDQGFTDKA